MALITQYTYSDGGDYLVGSVAREWLDRIIFDNTSQLFIIVCSLLSVFIALYIVIRQVKSLNK